MPAGDKKNLGCKTVPKRGALRAVLHPLGLIWSPTGKKTISCIVPKTLIIVISLYAIRMNTNMGSQS